MRNNTEETKLKKLIAESRELAKTLDKFADELEKKKAPSVIPQSKAEGARGDIPLQQSVPKMPQPNERTETHECDSISRDTGGRQMNELTKIKQRILERIENYIADIEFAEEQELTEDEKTIFESVKDIINSEFVREFNTQLHTEQIIKSTIKEYIDKDCDDVTELLLSLSKDLCERIRKEC